ncbi:hypothetical protein B9J76_11580 [Lacticaseibacillus paracasei]|jgi:hypothetical protein|uniref:hypothetical protein n=1 Tax=Lacticaseibacillus paracasei TaxID=1597 RepID=UPI000343B6B1|nr:hypothetical protein [Lacticaseibacillus paracasei]AYG22373.1 hypothetical protein CFM84_03920 [Lacticaseibacillus paracasei]EPD06119.1 hypothetical protein Lpp78_05231 [Lacticaseibacillus paracasei subsp. paracasei CNCM I-2877]MCT3377838.1 hypothetical protein [Lacticaseibacillus paracasei]OSP83824.1 hypothetical protein B9J76_11580 [Lacticaseibacillus paracasei]
MAKIKLDSGQEVKLTDLTEIYIGHDGQLKLEYWIDVMSLKTATVTITERDMFRIKAAAIKSNTVDVDTPANMRKKFDHFIREKEKDDEQ